MSRVRERGRTISGYLRGYAEVAVIEVAAAIAGLMRPVRLPNSKEGSIFSYLRRNDDSAEGRQTR
jgi:hypothetical protein